MTVARVMPGSTEVSGGVFTTPSRTMKMFSPLASDDEAVGVEHQRLVVAAAPRLARREDRVHVVPDRLRLGHHRVDVEALERRRLARGCRSCTPSSPR